MKIKFYAVFIVGFFLFSAKTFSQNGTYGNSVLTEMPNTAIDSNINGFIEVLPVGYDPSKKYPLIIFMEGQSQFGNGSPTELKNLYGVTGVPMFPDLVKSGAFTNSYSVNSTTYKFIVLIPQARYQVKHGRPSDEQMLSPSEVNDVINYALQNYSVDVNRIYLMGLSLGGGSTWNYPGQSVVYGNRVAAIVPFAGASDLAYPTHSRVTNIATANVPVWTFVATADQPYANLGKAYIDSILIHPEHTTEALITTYGSGFSHDDTWIQPLVNHNTGQSYTDVFQWLLGYSLGANGRAAQAQPVFANVDAGGDQTLQLPNGSMVLSTHSVSFNNATVTLTGTVSAGGPAIATIQWAKVDGVGGAITNPGSATTTVTNLKPGIYTFQLRVTDVNGLVTVDNVKVTVLAPPDNSYLKVGADTYTSKSSANNPLIDPTFFDQGAVYGLGYWSAGQWAQYTLPSNLAAGNYALYYRYNSLYGNPVIQISSGTTNRTFTLATTSNDVWQSDSLHLSLTPNSTIRFLSQSSDVGTTWNFDYFELALLSADAALPLKFVYSNAQCNGNTVNLQWKTAQEQNTKEFSIQRSTDGTNWTEIGKSTAAGQSSQERSYLFVDKSASANSMYRIVETDIAGQQTMSSIVRSSCSSTRNEITLYPNPNTGASALNVSLPEATSITFQVLDIKGAVMQQKQIQLPAGSSTVPVNITNYPNGVYTIAVRYNGEMKTIKMIKK
jgi:dienelactone hydrolase